MTKTPVQKIREVLEAFGPRMKHMKKHAGAIADRLALNRHLDRWSICIEEGQVKGAKVKVIINTEKQLVPHVEKLITSGDYAADDQAPDDRAPPAPPVYRYSDFGRFQAVAAESEAEAAAEAEADALLHPRLRKAGATSALINHILAVRDSLLIRHGVSSISFMPKEFYERFRAILPRSSLEDP